MFADMTEGSNHTLAISRKGIERNCCAPCRQKKPRCEICHFSGSRTKNRHSKSPCRRTCLTFCFKDRTRMEQKELLLDSHVEGTEGRFRDLTAKWFIDTQLPFIVHNGLFPTWFMGFITRKDAEEMLREKEQGFFLIRLSDKAIGYILSYKGRDRCRHFVINQSESGEFIICGDTKTHETVSDLTEYYKTSPIQPFGEYLISSCFEALDEELYDNIQVRPEEKLVATVGAGKNMQKQQSSASEQPPARPPKSHRTLQEAPPLPRRSRHLDSDLLNDQDRVLYAQLRKLSPREMPRFHICQKNAPGDNPGISERVTTQRQNIKRFSPPSVPDSIYSELSLLDSKSTTLPLYDSSSFGEQSYSLSAPPHTPPRHSPKPIRQVTCHDDLPFEKTDLCSGLSSSRYNLESISTSAVYHLAGRPGSPHTTLSATRLEQHRDSLYAEIHRESLTGHFPPVNTLELKPGHKDTVKTTQNNNTDEPVEEIRPRHYLSAWGLKNDKWKWPFPEVKRKW